MEYTVALQLPDKSEIDRQSMRLDWAAPAVQTPEPQPPAPTPAQAPVQQQQTPPAPQQAAVEARRIDQNELNLLVKRGEELMTTGDISSARLLLRRAAEAQDARAALALAASYDPIELRRLGVYGSTPDVVQARDWYEKARQFGSREAPRRLELLASQYR
jgi:TPR repeat protein